MFDTTQKRTLIISNMLLIVGLLSHSIILFFLNINFNPMTIAEKPEFVQLRIVWRQSSEKIFVFFILLYIIGHCIVFYAALKKKVFISASVMIIYIAAQVCIMLLCTMPFAFLDAVFFADYIFPVWSVLGTFLITVLIFVILNVFKFPKV